MTVTSNGTKGEPQFTSTGNNPTFAQDLSDVSTYAALVGNRKVGTAAARTALTGSAVWDGLEFAETDTGMVLLRVGGVWLPARQNIAGAALQAPSATNTFLNQGSYVPFPVAADAAALQISFTKYAGTSKLRVTMAATAQLSSGVAQSGFLGLRVNSVDFNVAKRRFNAATDRQTLVGTVILTGSAAGTYNILPVFHGSGASVFEFFNDDTLTYTVEEF
jgi:hypothetical protein